MLVGVFVSDQLLLSCLESLPMRLRTLHHWPDSVMDQTTAVQRIVLGFRGHNHTRLVCDYVREILTRHAPVTVLDFVFYSVQCP